MDGKIQHELTGFIRGHQQLIEQVITHSQVLGDEIRRRIPPAVLCHADIHAANIIADPAGRLWVIDWDGVMLAPRERDLMFWCSTPSWPDIAAGYGLNDPSIRSWFDIMNMSGWCRRSRIMARISTFCLYPQIKNRTRWLSSSPCLNLATWLNWR